MSSDEKFSVFRHWKTNGHVLLLIFLQILFICLFAQFVRYDPTETSSAVPIKTYFLKDEDNDCDYVKKEVTLKNGTVVKQNVANTYTHEEGTEILLAYPMFQDVHVMIFIGFGFLMTFLKKYGLTAVSLNMLVSVVCLQWGLLVFGWTHLHCGTIYLNLGSMLGADFAAATVLISFGVLIGKTSPLQLIVMALIEIVLFFGNEIIGRKYLGAVDAGDTIFVHTFGAYFGLAISRVLYDKRVDLSKNEGSSETHDMFSMIGAIFLWMFWPSFNSAAVVVPDAQHRAVLNTFFSLCASVLSSFAFSSLMNEKKKFVMEHIQNATLAGGVAIGACADLMVQPWAALLVGTIAGTISVYGFDEITPAINKYFKIHDTCGVHNLHGMPGIIGSLLSVIITAATANKAIMGDSLKEIFPYVGDEKYSDKYQFGNAGKQGAMQLAALGVTLGIAIVGGTITGFILKALGKFQEKARVRQSSGTGMAMQDGSNRNSLASDAFFDDHLYFEVHDDAFYESQKKYHLDLAKMVQTISGIKQANPDPSRYPGQGRPGPSGHYNGSQVRSNPKGQYRY